MKKLIKNLKIIFKNNIKYYNNKKVKMDNINIGIVVFNGLVCYNNILN